MIRFEAFMDVCVNGYFHSYISGAYFGTKDFEETAALLCYMCYLKLK
jgi:hypothetical protein